jgi:hypothetical protein
MTRRGLTRLRRLCLALPEAHEVEAWGEPTFRVRNRLFAMYAAAGNHHGNGRAAVWCKAAPGNQQLMVKAAPDRWQRDVHDRRVEHDDEFGHCQQREHPPTAINVTGSWASGCCD